MLWQTIFFGIVLGIVIAKLNKIAFEKQQSLTHGQVNRKENPILPVMQNGAYGSGPHIRSMTIRLSDNRVYPRVRDLSGRIPLAEPQPSENRLNEQVSARSLVWNWRRSIAGLVELSQRNLRLAMEHLRKQNYGSAVACASVSAENIACALIHCYGGKPDQEQGQEEVLRMLSRRFEEEERKRFEKALDDFVCICKNKAALRTHSVNDSSMRFFDEASKQAIKCAAGVVGSFKRIMIEHFKEEIPELLAVGRIPGYTPME